MRTLSPCGFGRTLLDKIQLELRQLFNGNSHKLIWINEALTGQNRIILLCSASVYLRKVRMQAAQNHLQQLEMAAFRAELDDVAKRLEERRGAPCGQLHCSTSEIWKCGDHWKPAYQRNPRFTLNAFTQRTCKAWT